MSCGKDVNELGKRAEKETPVDDLSFEAQTVSSRDREGGLPGSSRSRIQGNPQD